MLGAPLDKGFNRLAWLFPYLAGAGGVVAVGAGGRALVAAPRAGRQPEASRDRSELTTVSTMSSATSTEDAERQRHYSRRRAGRANRSRFNPGSSSCSRRSVARRP